MYEFESHRHHQNFMTQLMLNLESVPIVEGKCLDPQPGRESYDCIEDYRNPGTFNFYDGNEIDGHRLIMKVKSPNLEIIPHYDFQKRIWVWKKINNETSYQREYWKKQLK